MKIKSEIVERVSFKISASFALVVIAFLPSLKAQNPPSGVTEVTWPVPYLVPWDSKHIILRQGYKGRLGIQSAPGGWGRLNYDFNMGEVRNGWVPVAGFATTESGNSGIRVGPLDFQHWNGGGRDDVSSIVFDRDGNYEIGQRTFMWYSTTRLGYSGRRDYLKSIGGSDILTHFNSDRSRGHIYVFYALESSYFIKEPEVVLELR